MCCDAPVPQSGMRTEPRAALEMAASEAEPVIACGEYSCESTSPLSTRSTASAGFGDSSLTEDSVAPSEFSCEPEEPLEPEVMDSVQGHLEMMNAASDELNSSQIALDEHVKEQGKQVQRWTIGSARMARVIGRERLAKATPFYEQRRRCWAARRAVTMASARYMQLLEAGASESETSKAMARHAYCLEVYQGAQEELERLRRKAALSSKALEAVRPYFDAEQEHRARLAELNAKIKQTGSSLDSAKEQYRGAMRSLEDLSEQAHRQRGTIA